MFDRDFARHALRHPFDAARMVYRRHWRDRHFGRRVMDGGEWGVLVRCGECGGSGTLHRPDVQPPVSKPSDGLDVSLHWSSPTEGEVRVLPPREPQRGTRGP
jgi:hypothetical protein